MGLGGAPKARGPWPKAGEVLARAMPGPLMGLGVDPVRARTFTGTTRAAGSPVAGEAAPFDAASAVP